MPTVNLIDPATGEVFAVDDANVDAALGSGWVPENPDAAANRVIQGTIAADYSRPGDKLTAGLAGFTRGATLGLSDVLAGLGEGGDERVAALRRTREANPITSGVSEVVGALAPALASGGAGELGALARATPSGWAASLGARIAESGGLVRTATAGAFEGALQTGGSYVSDVALKNKPLSAEAFLAAMGKGALFGGGASALLGVSERAFTTAKRLFPKQEVTREAAEAAQHEATEAVDTALTTGAAMDAAATQQVETIAATKAATDPDFAAQLQAARLAKMQADAAAAQARAATAQARQTLAEERLAAARAPKQPKPKRTRRAMEEPALPAAEPAAQPPAVAEPVLPPSRPAPPAGDDLEALLGQSVQRAAAGEPIAALNAEARVPDPVAALVAAGDPAAAKIVEAQRALAAAKADVEAVLARPGRSTKDVAAAWGKQAETQAGLARVEGRLRRDQDSITELAGDATVHEGQSFESYLVQRGRERTSRLRDEYTPDEIAQRSADNPVFRDLADVQHGSPAELRARMRVDGSNELAERILTGRTSPETLEIEQMVNEGGRLRRVVRPATGEDILAAVQKQAPDIADLVERALARPVGRGSGAALAEDLAPEIEAITRYEAAAADLAEALGPAAPPAAAEHAAAFRAAQAQQGDQLAAATAATADDAARAFTPDAAAAARAEIAAPAPIDTALATATVGLPAPPAAPAPAARGALGALADAGAALEVLQALNVPGLPDPSRLPLIGPVLGVYLKARAAMGIWKRLGGKVPRTAETEVATRAAAARQRLHDAVGKMLDAGAAGARRARQPVAELAAILGHRLFDDGEPAPRRRAAPAPDDDVRIAYRARVDEIARAAAPDAIRRAVRARVGVGDPELLDEIVGAVQRKLSFLDGKLTKQPSLPTVLKGGRSTWDPSRAELCTAARYVAAADDPVGVLEQLASGGDVSPESAEAVRAIYPALFAEAQRALLERAATMEHTLPYRRRVALSVLFDVPLDGTLEPSYVAYLQQAGSAASPAPAPAGPQAPAIAADIALASRVGTDLDRRAAGGI